jgi:amino-acid N-acetyltransferase
MKNEVVIRKADRRDLPAVESLLTRSDLPTVGLHDTRLFVLESQGSVRGVVGYEVHGPYALLRSLAVDPSSRGRGYGRDLLRCALGEIAAEGVRAAYALTTTIPEMLARRGFREVRRDEVPEQLNASAELRGACCASARVFVLTPTPASPGQGKSS